jgi:hypothetical protein
MPSAVSAAPSIYHAGERARPCLNSIESLAPQSRFRCGCHVVRGMPVLELGQSAGCQLPCELHQSGHRLSCPIEILDVPSTTMDGSPEVRAHCDDAGRRYSAGVRRTFCDEETP